MNKTAHSSERFSYACLKGEYNAFPTVRHLASVKGVRRSVYALAVEKAG